VLPGQVEGRRHVYHLYVIRAQRRDDLLAHLKDSGIDAGVHYPVPLHLQPAYAWMGHKAGDLPETERAAAEVLSLPIYPELSEEQQDSVVEAVRRFFA
jgi:dTDP-4-amino-4,6-dideoxygalactose transaminase